MLLSTLHPHILALILDKVGGISLIRLWLTGDRQLHHVLSRGGVQSANFTLSSGSHRTSRLPGVIRFFSGLTSLTIMAPWKRIAHPQRLWDTISVLSQLKNLKLSFHGAEEWLFYPSEDFARLGSCWLLDDSPAESTASIEAEAQVPAGLELRPLESTFPLLESLSLTSPKSLLTIAHLRFLPKTLRVLKLISNGNIDSTAISHLHIFPYLHTICLGAANNNLVEGILPPSVTSLEIGSSEDGPHLNIPRTFWGSSQIIKVYAALDLNSILALPSTVERLQYLAVGTEEWSSVDLTHLSSLRHLCGLQLYSNGIYPHIPILPPVVESLRLEWYCSASARSSTSFCIPENLRNLDIIIRVDSLWENIFHSLTNYLKREGKV